MDNDSAVPDRPGALGCSAGTRVLLEGALCDGRCSTRAANCCGLRGPVSLWDGGLTCDGTEDFYLIHETIDFDSVALDRPGALGRSAGIRELPDGALRDGRCSLRAAPCSGHFCWRTSCRVPSRCCWPGRSSGLACRSTDDLESLVFDDDDAMLLPAPDLVFFDYLGLDDLRELCMVSHHHYQLVSAEVERVVSIAL